MELKRIEKLYWEGEFDEVLRLIEELSPEDALEGMIFKSGVLNIRGLYQNAVDLTTEVLQQNKITDDQTIRLGALFFHLWALLFSGGYEDFLEYEKEIPEIGHADEDNKSEQLQKWIALLLFIQSIKESFIGDYEKGLELGNKALSLGTKISYPLGITSALIALCVNYKSIEEPTVSNEYGKKALLIAKQNNFKFWISIIYGSLGFNCHKEGDVANSLKYYDLGLTLGKEVGYKYAVDFITWGMGDISAALGNYDLAIQQFQRGYEVAKERNDLWLMFHRSNDLGLVYRSRGDLSEALTAFQECLKIGRELGNRFFESHALHSLGTIYHDRGGYQEAFRMLEKSLNILSESFPRSLAYTTTLFALLLLSIESGDIVGAKEYLTKMEDIQEIETNLIIRIKSQLANALVLKASSRMKDKISAQEIFETIANTEGIEHDIYTFAMLNLCEILIFEYKSTSDKEILKEILLLSQRLYKTGYEKNAYPTIVKALLLQGKLFLIDGDLKKVEDLLDEAKEIAEEKGLGNLLNVVVKEKKQVNAEIEKWNYLLSRNAPVQDRIKQAALDIYIRNALQILNFGQNEELADFTPAIRPR